MICFIFSNRTNRDYCFKTDETHNENQTRSIYNLIEKE